MAKTRLNREKRDILRGLAIKIVKDTPINPDIEKRVKNAKHNYKKTFSNLVTVAKTIRNNAFPAAEEKILKKYNLTDEHTHIMFTDEETRQPIRIELFDVRSWELENEPAEGIQSATYEVRCQYDTDRRIAQNACQYAIPKSDRYTSFHFVANRPLMKLYNKLQTIKDELQMATESDADMRHVIMRDFEALIFGSKTFEEVVEIWPEATQLTDRICSDGTSVTLVSDEAKARIMQNMITRNIQL